MKTYGPRRLKALRPKDPNWEVMIDSLWREYYALYNEKYKKYEEKDEEGNPIDPWLRNKISEEISYGQALGQDHQLEGNRSAAFGQGAVTKSFLEIVLGAYNLIPEDQNPLEWIPTDLLLTLGNGPDEDNRSNVFEILKNGFFKFLQSIKIGAHPALAEGQTPENGTLQWTPEKGLEEWDTDHWKPVGSNTTIIDDRDNITTIIENHVYYETTTQQFITYINNEWITLDQDPDTIYPESENQTSEGKHTHKFEPGKLVTQPAHTFIVGNCIKRSGSTWILSKADTRANAGTVGIVSEVIDADHFRYIPGGLLPGDFVDGADYFLSTTTAGAIFIQSDPEVWDIGNVREFIGTGTANGLEVEIDLGDEITEFVFTDASIEDIAFDFNDVSGSLQTYYLDVKASFRYKILNCTLESDGSLTGISVKINDVAVTGLSGLTISTKITNTATALNVVEINDVIKLVITSYSGSTVPSLIRGKLKTQRL